MPENENPHKDHRKRMRMEFLKNGFNKDTPNHKVLEMILFYCIPRVDTNELAHRLLNRYKTLSGVFAAPLEELIKYPGITENGIALLKLFPTVANYCAREKKTPKRVYRTPESVGDYIMDQFVGITEERIAILLLDGTGRKIDFRFIGNGDVASVGVSLRTIVQICLATNAAAVVLAHNHPSNIALPSSEDLTVTKIVSEGLNSIGIKLIDHIIVVEEDYVSLSQSKSYKSLF